MTFAFLKVSAFTFKKRNVKMYSVLYMKIHGSNEENVK